MRQNVDEGGQAVALPRAEWRAVVANEADDLMAETSAQLQPGTKCIDERVNRKKTQQKLTIPKPKIKNSNNNTSKICAITTPHRLDSVVHFYATSHDGCMCCGWPVTKVTEAG